MIRHGRRIGNRLVPHRRLQRIAQRVVEALRKLDIPQVPRIRRNAQPCIAKRRRDGARRRQIFSAGVLPAGKRD